MRKLFYTFLFLLFLSSISFGASVVVSPKFTALDSSGDPLSGGKLYTYECGGTTPKTTYTTYTEGTANANPVVLDSRGEASVYSSDCLKLVLKDSASTTIWTVDNIYSFDNSQIQDADRDTKIQTEESSDEDVIRFDVGGSQKMYIDSDGVHIGTTVTTEANGRVERPKFRWKDADEIYIGAGAYHHSGTSDQFVYWNSEITFELESAGSNASSDDYGADGWHYIYLDDSAIVTQASALLDADCFLNDTTAPTYSATKHGWYNGNDRCIFAVYETSDAIVEFYHDGGEYVYRADYKNLRGQADLDNSFVAVDASTVLPGFAQRGEMTFFMELKADAAVTMSWETTDQTGTTGSRVLWGERIGTDQYFGGTCTVITDTSQSFGVKLSVSDASEAGVDGLGWYFPMGM